jgi:hypothetical protein
MRAHVKDFPVMSWFAPRSPHRPARRLGRRRSLLVQPLEHRRVLADLGIDIGFFTERPGLPANEIQTSVLRGETFFVEVQVQDQRAAGPAGVIALPLNIDWNSDVLNVQYAGNQPPSGSLAGDPIVTAKFPQLRSVGAINTPTVSSTFDPNNPSFDLEALRGGAIPALGSGQAIGVTAPESFSQLSFVATANATETFITVQLAGAMSFADAALLEDVVGIDATTEVAGIPNTVRAGVAIVGGSISGTKFNDLNGNGARDVGEPGVQGVAINLVRTDAVLNVAPVLTDANGDYLFADLPKGEYVISETLPAGSQRTTPANPYNVELNQSNQNVTDLDFGNFNQVIISGTKFNDLNGNGSRDTGESGVEGVTINLDLNNDGSIDATTLTIADGTYQFTGVGPGTHAVTETSPAGFEQTLPANNQGYVRTVTSGENNANLDFGNREVLTSVSGEKFNDINGDGIRQAGENGVGGITIQIDVNRNGTDIRSVITSGDGSFRFDNIPAGMHSVAEMLPINAVQTTPNGVFMIDVNPPAIIDNLLFGNFTLTSLSGVTFEDTNGNNLQDAGELGIAGVTAQLDLDSDGSIDLSVLTDASGRYVFTDVRPGTHRITEIVPTGFISPPTPAEYSILNRSGVNRDDLNFALRRQPEIDGSIQGFVYTDNDFDGVFDAHEFGLPDFVITLTSADNTITRTTTSSADGSYVFSNLPAGNYRIAQTQKSGFGDASISLGKVLPGGTSRGTSQGFNTFVGVQLGDNETAIDYNFGEVLTAVTKRMTLASTNVRQELATDAGVSSISIRGTQADDLIKVINRGQQGFEIFVNDLPGVVVRPEQASQVTIDGLGGADRIEYTGSDQAEQISARPAQLSVITPSQSLGVFNVDAIRVNGGGGNDTAILRDSTGADTLGARNSELLLLLASGQSIGVLNVPMVQAISDTDAETDAAEVATIDFVLQLVGDWT